MALFTAIIHNTDFFSNSINFPTYNIIIHQILIFNIYFQPYITVTEILLNWKFILRILVLDINCKILRFFLDVYANPPSPSLQNRVLIIYKKMGCTESNSNSCLVRVSSKPSSGSESRFLIVRSFLSLLFLFYIHKLRILQGVS